MNIIANLVSSIILLGLFLENFIDAAPVTLTTGFTLDYLVLDTDSNGSSDTIKFTLQSNTVGYLSIGFGGATMSTAFDYVVGNYVNNAPVVKDYMGTFQQTMPNLDSNTQDFTVVTAECARTASSTKIVFQRQLNTLDGDDLTILLGKQISFVWARGSTDTFEKHTSRGSSSITFIDPQATVTTPSANAVTLTTGFTLDYLVLDSDKNGASDTIKFTLSSNTVGYLSIGFGGSTMSTAFDYAVGNYVNNAPVVNDYMGTFKQTMPTLDANKQDFTVVTAECARTASSTKIVFQRQLNTLDGDDLTILLGKQISFVWARGSSDTFEQHSSRGSSSITFIDPLTGGTNPGTNSTTNSTTNGTTNSNSTNTNGTNFNNNSTNFNNTNYNNTNFNNTNFNNTNNKTSTTISATSSFTLTPGYTLSYELKDTNADQIKDRIQIQLVTDTTGWIGIGLGGKTMTTSSDYIVAYYQNNIPMVYDYYANGQDTPRYDNQQDITVIVSECSRVSGRTTFVFERNLNTGDSFDYALRVGSTIDVIWARGANDMFQQHVSQGSYSLQLVDKASFGVLSILFVIVAIMILI